MSYAGGEGYGYGYGGQTLVGERRVVDIQTGMNHRSKLIEVPVVHHETRVPVEYEVPVQVPVQVPVRVEVPYPVERIVEVPHEVVQEREVVVGRGPAQPGFKVGLPPCPLMP